MANQTEIEVVRNTAQQLRSDFVNHNVTPEAIITATELYLPEFSDSWRGVLEQVGLAVKFPIAFCGFASVVLRERLGYGEVIKGRYTTNLRSWQRLLRNEAPSKSPHVFLSIGETALSKETIVDITADQFKGGQEVYVGPLELPWSAD